MTNGVTKRMRPPPGRSSPCSLPLFYGTAPPASMSGRGEFAEDARSGAIIHRQMDSRAPYRFGAFELDVPNAQLRRDGAPVKLAPQPFAALALLVERAGALVTREEMRAALWGDDRHVDVNAGVNFCMAQLRAALGEDAPLLIPDRAAAGLPIRRAGRAPRARTWASRAAQAGDGAGRGRGVRCPGAARRRDGGGTLRGKQAGASGLVVARGHRASRARRARPGRRQSRRPGGAHRRTAPGDRRRPGLRPRLRRISPRPT